MFTFNQKDRTSVKSQLVLLGATLILGNLADIIHKSSRVYLFQQAQCLAYYRATDPSHIQSHFHVDEALCKVSQVQSPLATIDGLDSFLAFLPRESSFSFQSFTSFALR